MLFREIFKEDILIGLIGWNNSEPVARSSLESNQTILESFLSPISIEEAVLVSGMSLSSKRLVLPSSPEWIGFMNQLLPIGFKAGNVNEIENKKFWEIKID